MSCKIPRPTRAEVNALAKAYALKIHSAEGATFDISVRLHNKFERKLKQLKEKYPGFDFDSSRSMEALEYMAEKWWKSQLIHGPGKDW